jgi:hypothetical protein
MRWLEEAGDATGSCIMDEEGGRWSAGSHGEVGNGNGNCVRIAGGDFLITTLFNRFSIVMTRMFNTLGQAKSMAGISNAFAFPSPVYYV